MECLSSHYRDIHVICSGEFHENVVAEFTLVNISKIIDTLQEDLCKFIIIFSELFLD